MDIGHGVSLETVDEICHRPIGHILDADRGCYSAVTPQVDLHGKASWVLTHTNCKGLSLAVKGKMYVICVTCRIYHSEPADLRRRNGDELDWNENDRGMFEVKLDERKKNDELRELETVSLMIKNGRLNCFGHVERSPNLLSPHVVSNSSDMRWRLGLGAEPRWRTYSASPDPLLHQGEGRKKEARWRGRGIGKG